jgi:hypothetical protein
VEDPSGIRESEGARPVRLAGVDDYRTFWVDPDETEIEAFEHLMAGK